MKRYDIINHYITTKNYKSYLEIGTDCKDNFNKVNCNVKECIDPAKNTQVYTYNMPSDGAFELIKKENKKYDIIFIDGLHIEEQVDKDIQNSLQVLTVGGIIVMHDCNPTIPKHASDPRISNCWNGTTYKSFVKLRITKPDLFMFVVDTDYGCGVIYPSKKQECYDINLIPDNLVPNNDDKIVNGPIIVENKEITWRYFNKNKKQLLNLITPEQFKKL